MQLSTVQRAVSFVAIVIVLAGLGVYLFLPPASGVGRPAEGRARGAQSPAASALPATSPATSPASGPAGRPDIYRWLPFTQAGLAAAASVAVRFAADYGTFSYTQTAAAYLAPMRPLVTRQLAELLGRAFATPGVAASRTSERQISTAAASVSALRSFGSSSLTFIVMLRQRITGTTGVSRLSGDYAITLTGSGTSWQASDIELAAAGNQ